MMSQQNRTRRSMSPRSIRPESKAERLWMTDVLQALLGRGVHRAEVFINFRGTSSSDVGRGDLVGFGDRLPLGDLCKAGCGIEDLSGLGQGQDGSCHRTTLTGCVAAACVCRVLGTAHRN